MIRVNIRDLGDFYSVTYPDAVLRFEYLDLNDALDAVFNYVHDHKEELK